MKILLHDYAGHPFQAELSRRLASRGHEVVHAFFAADAGPKGRMTLQPGDPDTLGFLPITLPGAYSKTDFIKRRMGDIEYGKALAAAVREISPDVVLSGNTPTEAQDPLPKACRDAGAAFIYWCQDFYSIAADRLLRRKLPVAGHLVGALYKRLDKRQMTAADHVILITDSFRRQTDAWGISPDKISVIPNWGAIEELPLRPKANEWAAQQGLGARPTCLYTGTLAMKHDPGLLLDMARDGAVDVVVVASGVGVETLERSQAESPLPNLRLLPLQPFERFADVLGSADILVAVIEEDAGEFSVPSKVLSYLCAGRPIVLSAPPANLAAQIVMNAGAGTVVAPGDNAGFINAVRNFVQDLPAAERAGRAGRAYAEANFDLDRVADRFEEIFMDALSSGGRHVT